MIKNRSVNLLNDQEQEFNIGLVEETVDLDGG